MISDQDDSGGETAQSLHEHLEGGGGEVQLGVLRVHERHPGKLRHCLHGFVGWGGGGPELVGVEFKRATPPHSSPAQGWGYSLWSVAVWLLRSMPRLPIYFQQIVTSISAPHKGRCTLQAQDGILKFRTMCRNLTHHVFDGASLLQCRAPKSDVGEDSNNPGQHDGKPTTCTHPTNQTFEQHSKARTAR